MDAGSSISVVPRYLLLIGLLLIGGAYFAAAETAFASVNRIRMISDADDGSRKAKKVLYVLDHFDKALTTLLIGNNVMHIATSSAATLLASKLWGNSAVTATTFVTSFVVFILAEMIPKSYAKACNEKLAPRLAGSLVFLMRILSPVCFFFSGISSVVSAMDGSNPQEEQTVTEEELFDVIENIDAQDDIDEDTTELVQSALEFTETTAADILVPWDKVQVITDEMTEAQIVALIRTNTRFSRFPYVYGGSVKGILQVRKYLKELLSGNTRIRVKDLLDKPVYIYPDMPIDELLDYLSSRKAHMGIVRSDSGQILGILTVEDILEELVGEIYDEEENGGDV
ncbi:MAG: HlyC/CorC family transporter [Firmicutes bacterium]|nr:HlyC/CorC family transporter [Bacillota bacterium]